MKPNGYTPLTACYDHVLREKLQGREGKILVVIATDGPLHSLLCVPEPTAACYGITCPPLPSLLSYLMSPVWLTMNHFRTGAPNRSDNGRWRVDIDGLTFPLPKALFCLFYFTITYKAFSNSHKAFFK
jgi:hypothetical protein